MGSRRTGPTAKGAAMRNPRIRKRVNADYSALAAGAPEQLARFRREEAARFDERTPPDAPFV